MTLEPGEVLALIQKIETDPIEPTPVNMMGGQPEAPETGGFADVDMSDENTTGGIESSDSKAASDPSTEGLERETAKPVAGGGRSDASENSQSSGGCTISRPNGPTQGFFWILFATISGIYLRRRSTS